MRYNMAQFYIYKNVQWSIESVGESNGINSLFKSLCIFLKTPEISPSSKTRFQN